jgi:hypothetical protein
MWAVLHEVRSEWAQLMSCFFLAFAGPGRWSLDALIGSRREPDSAIREGDVRPFGRPESRRAVGG